MVQSEEESYELVHAAAIRGVASAQAMYGQMLLDGKHVERNPSAALHWFERAAQGGDVMAMNMVGRCLEQGWGIARNATLAAKWFRSAAERGLDWGMYNLASLLTLGEGVPQDKAQAYQWLRRAAELDHAKSINLLGGFYEDGWVVRQDRAIARDHYRRAALGGDFRGQFNYARFLIEEDDLLGALHWLRKVPETATPTFLEKMTAFLAAYPQREVQEFADAIAATA